MLCFESILWKSSFTALICCTSESVQQQKLQIGIIYANISWKLCWAFSFTKEPKKYSFFVNQGRVHSRNWTRTLDTIYKNGCAGGKLFYTISRIKGTFPILLILILFYQLFFNYLNMLVLMWCIDACLVIEIAFYCSIFLYLSFHSHINAVCVYCNLINKRVSRWHEVFRYLNFPHIWLHSNIFLKR